MSGRFSLHWTSYCRVLLEFLYNLQPILETLNMSENRGFDSFIFASMKSSHFLHIFCYFSIFTQIFKCDCFPPLFVCLNGCLSSFFHSDCFLVARETVSSLRWNTLLFFSEALDKLTMRVFPDYVQCRLNRRTWPYWKYSITREWISVV